MMVGKYLGSSQRPAPWFWRLSKLALADYQRLGTLYDLSVTLLPSQLSGLQIWASRLKFQ